VPVIFLPRPPVKRQKENDYRSGFREEVAGHCVAGTRYHTVFMPCYSNFLSFFAAGGIAINVAEIPPALDN